MQVAKLESLDVQFLGVMASSRFLDNFSVVSETAIGTACRDVLGVPSDELRNRFASLAVGRYKPNVARKYSQL